MLDTAGSTGQRNELGEPDLSVHQLGVPDQPRTYEPEQRSDVESRHAGRIVSRGAVSVRTAGWPRLPAKLAIEIVEQVDDLVAANSSGHHPGCAVGQLDQRLSDRCKFAGGAVQEVPRSTGVRPGFVP